MGCGVFWQQVNEIDSALRTMRKFGVPEGMPAFNVLGAQRSKLMAQVGFKFPRSILQLIRIVGLSPGVIALFLDVEAGFMSEARPTPSSPPVYKMVPGETAAKILKHDISPELEAFLMTPDEDQDN